MEYIKESTLVQALRLCTGRSAHKESRGIDQPFLDHGTRRGGGVSVTPRPIKESRHNINFNLLRYLCITQLFNRIQPNILFSL